MQSESDKNLEFSERTERICSDFGLKLSDLPVQMGISPAMFYAYRSGKNPISAKAWRKLESLEKHYGVRLPGSTGLRPAETADPMINEAPGLYSTHWAEDESTANYLRAEAEELMRKAKRLMQAADLIDQLRRKARASE